MNRKAEYFFHFVVLVCLLLVGTGFILFFRADKTMQTYSVIGLSVSYVLWGVLHHLKNGDLHSKIIAEYVLIAILGSLILLSVIR